MQDDTPMASVRVSVLIKRILGPVPLIPQERIGQDDELSHDLCIPGMVISGSTRS
jgi:hypothetical protein